MKKFFRQVVLILFYTSLFGCAEPVKPENPPSEPVYFYSASALSPLGLTSISVSVRAEEGMSPVVKIYPWKKGNEIDTGLLIFISNSFWAREIPYRPENSCYQEYINDYQDSLYRFRIKKGSVTHEFKLEYGFVDDSPRILYFSDETGRDAVDQQSLSSASVIYLYWTPDSVANAFEIDIFKEGIRYLTFSSEQNSYAFPAHTFETGKYSLTVRAVFEDGDKNYEAVPYYLLSSKTGDSFTFEVIP